MNFLLSNDDGYDKIGLLTLREVLSLYGNVYVSAPLTQKSGASCSLTINKDVNFTKIDEKTIAVDGTPADSLALGLAYFDSVKFDVVFSGVNEGLNISKDSLFSGTVGVGLVSSMQGYKTICLSSSFHETHLKEKTERILKFVFENRLFDEFPFLNINYPKHEFESGLGIRVGKCYNIPIGDVFVKNANGKYSTAYEEDQDGIPEDSDFYLCQNGYYSITPFKPSLEDILLTEKLKKKIDDLSN